MKSILCFLLLGTTIIACNDTDKNTPQPPPAVADAREQQYRDAITQYPDSMVLRKTLIQYFLDNDNFDKAIAETDIAITKDSADATLWDKKAELYSYKKDTAKAIAAYETAINILPDPQYVMSLGWLYAKTKNAKAIEVADALLLASKAKAEKEALLIKGLYYAETGDNNSAIAAFNNCLAIDYTFMFAYREKAIVQYNTGKYDAAVATLQKAVTLQNNFDDGYYWLGRCYEKLNNPSEAINNYKTALFYNEFFDEAKDALGRLGVK
jgi:tetratricopeptide (TPR) repeat protein